MFVPAEGRIVAVLSLMGMSVSLAGICGSELVAGDSQLAGDAEAPFAGMGVMVGEVTPTTALVQVRLTKSDMLDGRELPGHSGIVAFSLQQADGKGQQVTRSISARAERDFIARASFRDLQPGTRYRCVTRIGNDQSSLREGPVANFKTLPGPDGAEDVRFVVVTGMNYAKFHGDDRINLQRHLLENNAAVPKPYTGADKHLGYPALKSILEKAPDFLVGTGDNVYYDTPKEPRAQTTPELRQKWHEQFVQPRYRDLFAAVPTYWMIDDHDYRIDDCDNTGDYHPTPNIGRKLMLEQLPVALADDDQALTYRTHRVSRDLQIWFPENRMYRSPNKTPDGPEKSIWGKRQRDWLKQTLQASDATFKLLISPTPMVGPDDRRKTDNHTNIGGFRHERDEFFNWLKETGIDKQNFFILCGDRHWQYHSIDSTGIEEFSSGALVDANSRLGRKPGDPLSTDPDAQIQQPYYQTPPSGGFLLVTVEARTDQRSAGLTFSWHDELGNLLRKHIK
jgi:alkaline phosphatase D